MKLSKRKVISLVAALVALTLVASTWAYYSSSNSIDNKMETDKYGNQMVEKFTPNKDWQPGETVTKEAGVYNTGDYPLYVRIKMDETWNRPLATYPGDPATIAKSSTDLAGGFLTATAGSAVQTSLTDGYAIGDQSVVAKNFVGGNNWLTNPVYGNWIFGSDGYWYYKTALGTTNGVDNFTGNLLESITLAANTDMGVYDSVTYYTFSDKNQPPPAWDNIGNNPATQWVALAPGASLPDNTTYSRSVSDLAAGRPGYADGQYTLSITYQTIQATKDAVTDPSTG